MRFVGAGALLDAPVVIFLGRLMGELGCAIWARDMLLRRAVGVCRVHDAGSDWRRACERVLGVAVAEVCAGLRVLGRSPDSPKLSAMGLLACLIGGLGGPLAADTLPYGKSPYSYCLLAFRSDCRRF